MIVRTMRIWSDGLTAAMGTHEDKQQRQSEEVQRLFLRIIDEAAKNIVRIGEPELPFVPAEFREVVLSIHYQLSNCLKALSELNAAYDDLIVCYRVAASYPWENDEVTRHQHLNLAWSHFVNLCYLFEEKFKLVGKHFNVATAIFSIKNGSIDIRGGVREIQRLLGEHIRRRGQHVHQWNATHQAVKDFRLFETLRSAGQWPDDWPPFEEFYEAARDRLCEDISTAIDGMHETISGLLQKHGTQFEAMIQRYNELLEKFRSLAT